MPTWSSRTGSASTTGWRTSPATAARRHRSSRSARTSRASRMSRATDRRDRQPAPLDGRRQRHPLRGADRRAACRGRRRARERVRGRCRVLRRAPDRAGRLGARGDRAIPAERRKVVSFHDAFPYFAEAYGLEIVGTVIDAPGRTRAPARSPISSTRSGVGCNGAVRRGAVQPATRPDHRRRSGHRGGDGPLHRLARGPPADTYEGMIRWDVERVVGALQP